jgi:hypothetical protein
MNMKMRHAFTRIRAAIYDNAIAGLLDSEFFRKLAGDQQ